MIVKKRLSNSNNNNNNIKNGQSFRHNCPFEKCTSICLCAVCCLWWRMVKASVYSSDAGQNQEEVEY